MSKHVFISFKKTGTELTVTASYDNGKITATATGDCPERLGPAWRVRSDELIKEAGAEIRKKIAQAEGVAA